MITSGIFLFIVFVLWMAYRMSANYFPFLTDYIVWTDVALGVAGGIFVMMVVITIVKKFLD